MEFFEEIIFSYLEDIKCDKAYLSEQHSLIIMDTFKGQDNDTLRELCSENNCNVVTVSNNLISKFQLLDLSGNRTVKSFIQNKYSDWFVDQVSKQL